jgi:cellulose synthase (UDP-forming)
MLLVVGGILLLVSIGNSRRSATRTVVCLLVLAAALVFLDWRIGHTGIGLPGGGLAQSIWVRLFFAGELLCMVELFLFMLAMSRYRDNRPAADDHERQLRALAPEALPEVDVWIATYDESWQILEKTIVGVLSLDYPKGKLRVWVLDDTRRAWLGERCAELGVHHVTRPDNKGKKAGNHNHALGQTSAPFILSLDADFVPFPNFIYRVLGFFADPRVAILQTPQIYYNADPVRCGLGLHCTAPDELAFFYREIQPARDAWDAAFYCGSCAMIRRSAIEAIGGFVTETDIEDQATTVKLLAAGHCTRYLNEALSVGLCAESVAVMHDQRNRWCRGSVQIAFMPFGPFGRGLKLVHRLLFCMSYWLSSPVCSIIFAIAPFMLWGLGWKVYPAAGATDIAVLPFGLFAAVVATLTWVSRLHWSPLVNPAVDLFHAIELAPTAIASFVNPFGKPLIRIMPVTPKGAAAATRRVDLRTFSVLAVIIALDLGSFVWSILADLPRVHQMSELTACIAWTLYELGMLTVATLICFERPYRRSEERFEVAQSAELHAFRRTLPVLICDLSMGGARLRMEAPAALEPGDPFELEIPSIGSISGAVVRQEDAGRDEFGVRFGELAGETRHRLLRAIFTSPAVQYQPEAFALSPILTGLVRRFLRTA